ncbi:MAG: hypothetical protein ACE365_05640 [Gammaproteobacteria bacterium]
MSITPTFEQDQFGQARIRFQRIIKNKTTRAHEQLRDQYVENFGIKFTHKDKQTAEENAQVEIDEGQFMAFGMALLYQLSNNNQNESALSPNLRIRHFLDTAEQDRFCFDNGEVFITFYKNAITINFDEAPNVDLTKSRHNSLGPMLRKSSNRELTRSDSRDSIDSLNSVDSETKSDIVDRLHGFLKNSQFITFGESDALEMTESVQDKNANSIVKQYLSHFLKEDEIDSGIERIKQTSKEGSSVLDIINHRIETLKKEVETFERGDYSFFRTESSAQNQIDLKTQKIESLMALRHKYTANGNNINEALKSLDENHINIIEQGFFSRGRLMMLRLEHFHENKQLSTPANTLCAA